MKCPRSLSSGPVKLVPISKEAAGTADHENSSVCRCNARRPKADHQASKNVLRGWVIRSSHVALRFIPVLIKNCLDGSNDANLFSVSQTFASLGFVANKREVALRRNVEAESNHSLLDTSRFRK